MTQTFSNNQPNVNNSSVALAAQPSEIGVKKTMSSLEMAELAGKPHNDLLKSIRNMEAAWTRVTGGKFSLSNYVDSTGRKLPCYNFNYEESMYIASKFDDETRAKLTIRWAKLETGKAIPAYQKMPTAKELALMVIQAEEEKERLMLENKAQQEVIESQKPAVVFTSAVQAAVNSCLVGELAKILQQNGVNIGEKRLFKWLRENKYLGSHGERYNIPNQEYIERGYFELKKGTRSGDNGVMHTTITTKVTGKGQVYFVNKFLANKVKED